MTHSPSKAGDPIRGLAPLPPLRPAWLAAANDGSCEFRLAAALASQEVFLRFQGRAVVENIRAHWLPIDRTHAPSRFHVERHAARFAKDASGLAHDPDVVCKSDELERDCIALLRRRVQLAPQMTERGLGMIGVRGAEAGLADVMAFLAGQVDDARILALAKPLMALAWWKRERPRLDSPASDGVDAAYAIARITHLSAPLERSESINITLDPEPISRLAGGDLAGAIAVCLRRLRASGLSPVVRAVAGDAGYARRLAASLAFPIRPSDINRCANLVTKPHQFEESLHVR